VALEQTKKDLKNRSGQWIHFSVKCET